MNWGYQGPLSEGSVKMEKTRLRLNRVFSIMNHKLLGINLFCRTERRPGLWPACVECRMSQNLNHFLPGHAVGLGLLDMDLQRAVQYPAGHDGCYRHHAPIAGGQLRLSGPHLPKQNIVVQFRKFWSEIAQLIPSCCYLCYAVQSPFT